MPSVDRVGRYYPLTLAAPLASIPFDSDAQLELWLWLQRLEDAAIDALQEDWSIDLLETELLRVGLPPLPVAGAGTTEPGQPDMGRPRVAGFDSTADPSMASFFSACAAAAWPQARPPCIWYNEADISAPAMFCSPAMNDSVAQLWKG